MCHHLKTCYLDVAISCTDLDYSLLLLFAFAATMLTVSKDFHITLGTSTPNQRHSEVALYLSRGGGALVLDLDTRNPSPGSLKY